MTTTELAAQLSSDPRFLARDATLFDEMAAIHGRDVTGLAYVQASLKVGQERLRIRKILAERYGWAEASVTDEMISAVYEAGQAGNARS